MKRLVKIAICLASGLVLNAGTRADDAVLANNPYAPIVVRNIFGLNPVPTNDVNATPTEPPPKITPNGIMSIFGKWQVLFKVAGTPKPGQPAKDESYILSEGQRQDEIEVIQIDEKANLVTFNNHGTVQELPLVKANASAASTPTGRAVPNPNFAAPNGETSGRGRLGGGPAGGPGSARNRSRGDSSALTTVPTRGGYSGQATQAQNAMTPEEQALMIEANRMLTQKQVDEGSYPPLPPTVLTPPDATAHNGMPLIATPLPPR